VTTISSLPSALTSPSATSCTSAIAGSAIVVVPKPPRPSASSTLTSSVKLFAVTMSALPSPSTSPIATPAISPVVFEPPLALPVAEQHAESVAAGHGNVGLAVGIEVADGHAVQAVEAGDVGYRVAERARSITEQDACVGAEHVGGDGVERALHADDRRVIHR